MALKMGFKGYFFLEVVIFIANCDKDRDRGQNTNEQSTNDKIDTVLRFF
jgi:hypothetical protein